MTRSRARKSSSDRPSGTHGGTLNDGLQLARDSVDHAQDMLDTFADAQKVIAARTEPDQIASRPVHENLSEMARMVPEKAMAFGAAAAATQNGLARLGQTTLDYSLREGEAVRTLMTSPQTLANPLALSMWGFDAAQRLMQYQINLGQDMVRLNRDGLEPIARTVRQNRNRLKA
jgi:hypothetical protein